MGKRAWDEEITQEVCVKDRSLFVGGEAEILRRAPLFSHFADEGHLFLAASFVSARQNYD